ncbi:MAG: PEGA domain-containing protein [Deltaproteobacteria bacterium]|nr:PEGA domain-containing protein [Deltaproteobacteria bacterium]
MNANIAGARVLVDGRKVGTTPLSEVAVPAGEHRIGVEKDGYEPYGKRVRFEAGRSMTLYVDLSPERPRPGRLYVDTRPEEATRCGFLTSDRGITRGWSLSPVATMWRCRPMGTRARGNGLSWMLGRTSTWRSGWPICKPQRAPLRTAWA